jgi:hypothetical protein
VLKRESPAEGTGLNYTVILNYNTIVLVKLFLLFLTPSPSASGQRWSVGADKSFRLVGVQGTVRQMAKLGSGPSGTDRGWKVVTVYLQSGSLGR